MGNKNLNVVLLDDRGIRQLNRQHLNRDCSTDVISFIGEGDLLGEIAISVDTAIRQSRQRGIPVANELALLAVHGLLHLDGHDDTNLRAWKIMRSAEFEAMVKVL